MSSITNILSSTSTETSQKEEIESEKQEEKQFVLDKGASDKEFNELPYAKCEERDASLYPTALAPENKERNRYFDILPNEPTRFKFKDKETYFNANIVLNGSAIAAQGPEERELKEFWTMIKEFDATAIVALANPIERGEEKCANYWGITRENKVYTNGNENIVKRVIRFQGENVVQYHLQNWPDHGVVKVETLAKLIELFYEENKGPFIVHCSAGIGRTGTFCAVYEAYRQIQEGKKNPNIKEIVTNLRHPEKGRTGMVQTEKQYNLIYQTVDYLLKKNA